jgi:hypothetical protein
MPLFTKTVAAIASILAIPVFGVGIIAANYSSPILTHLVDIINGSNTQTVSSLNAPNWSEGIPLAVPVGVSVATTSGQTLASSTAFTVAIAALDGFGTTTISSAATITTDASTTEGVAVSWGAVPGATGYAVYVATGTVASFSQYFVTTTNAFTLGTTTGSKSGTNTLTDGTAFSVKINPLGASFFNGGRIGVGTSSPLANIDIASGTVRAIGASTSTCNSTNAGAIQYQSTSGHFYGCLSSGTWKQLDN